MLPGPIPIFSVTTSIFQSGISGLWKSWLIAQTASALQPYGAKKELLRLSPLEL
jgi:hypothetical protein